MQRPSAVESGAQDDKSLLQSPAVLGGIGAGAVAILAGLWLMLRRRGSSCTGQKTRAGQCAERSA